MPTQCRNAFTLIELLVVVSIIALLIAILLPTLASVRRSTIRTQCLSRQKQVTACMFTIATDLDGRFPRTYMWRHTGSITTQPSAVEFAFTDHLTWINRDVYDYMEDNFGFNNIDFTCPNRGDGDILLEEPDRIRGGFYFMVGRNLDNWAVADDLKDWDSPQSIDGPSDLVMTTDVFEVGTLYSSLGGKVTHSSHSATGLIYSEPNVKATPSDLRVDGINQSFSDGSASWVSSDQFRLFSAVTHGGIDGYWYAPPSRRP